MVRVSAIIIFYNEERFLSEAIKSVREQTYADWELILVDDGSTDLSTRIARQAASEDARIRLVTHPERANLGMSASRNRGITEASGEFIAFLDGDDVWIPEKLAEQVAIMDDEPTAGMVYGRTLLWHSWKHASNESDFYYPLGVAADRLHHPPALFNLLMRNKAQSPTTANALIRRSVIRKLGGFEDQFRSMFEDQVFFAKMHLGASCYVADRVWARYRQHETNCTGLISVQEELTALDRYLDWVSTYLRDIKRYNRTYRWPVLRARIVCRYRMARVRAARLFRKSRL